MAEPKTTTDQPGIANPGDQGMVPLLDSITELASILDR
jgi:hypothetical protein